MKRQREKENQLKKAKKREKLLNEQGRHSARATIVKSTLGGGASGAIVGGTVGLVGGPLGIISVPAGAVLGAGAGTAAGIVGGVASALYRIRKRSKRIEEAIEDSKWIYSMVKFRTNPHTSSIGRKFTRKRETESTT